MVKVLLPPAVPMEVRWLVDPRSTRELTLGEGPDRRTVRPGEWTPIVGLVVIAHESDVQAGRTLVALIDLRGRAVDTALMGDGWAGDCQVRWWSNGRWRSSGEPSALLSVADT